MKFCCFLRGSDSRVRDRYYHVKQWPLGGEMILVQKNVAHRALIDKTIKYLPPLHINLWLIKNLWMRWVKKAKDSTMEGKNSQAWARTKIKEGIFADPQVKQVFQDRHFENKLNDAERGVWDAFKKACSNFWEIKKSENYVEIVEDLLFSYLAVGCNMSWKIHFLQSHLDFFSGKYGSRFWRAWWKVTSG